MNKDIVPAGQPPAGVSSNFVDPVNHAPTLVACNIVLLIISISIIIARLVSRTYLTNWRLGWDDYSIIVALMGTAIFTSFVITTTKYGLGKHMWDVPISTYSPQYLWWIMATFAACPASYYFVKISILFFYLRVFQLKAKLRYIIYALFAYCTIYYWLTFATVIGLCNAKNRKWDITVTMNCFAYGELVFAIGGMDLIADALILAFPIPMVLKLHISWPQRIYLLFVFLAGIIASAACAIRIGLGVQARGSTDATMAQYRIMLMFCVEHYFALIAACMPTLGPFFRWLRPSHWRHEKMRDRPYRDAEAVHPVWSPARKTLTDGTTMIGSTDTVTPITKHYDTLYELRPQSLRQQNKDTLGREFVEMDARGEHQNDNIEDVVQMQDADNIENPK